MVFGLKHAFLVGLAAISAASQTNGLDAIFKRGLPAVSGDDRIPPQITLGNSVWTRQEILTEINNPQNKKPFKNNGLMASGSGWVPKQPLFEGTGAGSKLFELDLTRNPNDRGKYRAIVTGGNSFVGITEHVQNLNVKSVYDVNERIKSGAYLNVPERITAVGNQQFRRQDIAEAMTTQARKKLGNNEWAARVRLPNKQFSDTARVVYRGSEFLRIEEWLDSNVRVIWPSNAVLPADTAGRPSTSSGHGACGGLITKRDGTSSCLKHLQLSESVAQKKYEALASKFGVDDTQGHAIKPSFPAMREKFKKFTRLPSMAISSAFGKGATGLVTLGIYINDVVEVFSEDTSALDRATVATSVLPFVGCEVEAAAAIERDQYDLLDNSLCLIGDTLLVTPLWPVGVLVQLLRPILKDIENFNAEQVKRRRDEAWRAGIIRHKDYIQSGNFTRDIKAQLNMEKAVVIFTASEAFGKLNATMDLLAEIPDVDEQERARFASSIEKKENEVEEKICAGILHRMHTLHHDIPMILATSLSDQINNAFIDQYESMMRSKASVWDHVIASADTGVPALPVSFAEAVKQNVKHLRDNPPPAWEYYAELRGLITQMFDQIYELSQCAPEGARPVPGDRVLTLNQRRLKLYNTPGDTNDSFGPTRQTNSNWAVFGYNAPFPGTSRLVCGENREQAICEIGDDDLPPGSDKSFETWVYTEPILGVTKGGRVRLSRIQWNTVEKLYGRNYLNRPPMPNEEAEFKEFYGRYYNNPKPADEDGYIEFYPLESILGSG
ncbi:hypothetical protein HIM_05656 [Hirsutella minnesotensis 3608]|uniref:Enterotoxin n=1 Tax=Hirsutella minnesotensis 3608 TaxID=1043627 RepID=A0A0F7ZP58_9HYPO|nr:hypothetical protein HIM_05656 [Hirsutella minnesotensis 3608]